MKIRQNHRVLKRTISTIYQANTEMFTSIMKHMIYHSWIPGNVEWSQSHSQKHALIMSTILLALAQWLHLNHIVMLLLFEQTCWTARFQFQSNPCGVASARLKQESEESVQQRTSLKGRTGSWYESLLSFCTICGWVLTGLGAAVQMWRWRPGKASVEDLVLGNTLLFSPSAIISPLPVSLLQLSLIFSLHIHSLHFRISTLQFQNQ